MVEADAIINHIQSDTTPAKMPLHEAIAGARLLLDFAPTPELSEHIMMPRAAVASLLAGLANSIAKWHKAENFILEQTGTSDLVEAAEYLRKLRLRERLR